MGLYSVRGEFISASGTEKVIVLGRVFAASGLAAFGGEHMVNIGPFSPMVPRWLPIHPFWVVFFGLALLASALSLVLNKYIRLSATLTAVMFLVFILTLHIPEAIANPHDRFRWTVVLRETSFASGFLAFAGAHATRSKPFIVIGRVAAALSYLFFSIMHVLHPENAPGVPLAKLSPPWIFWPHVWATVTALILLTAGLMVLVNRYARFTAWLGLWMLLLTLSFTCRCSSPQDGMQLIEAVNYIFDTALRGTILLLASALPKKQPAPVAVMQTASERACFRR